jgi:hypothetical protein
LTQVTAAWAIVAILAGFAAAWLAARSVGLLAHSLVHSFTWVLLGAIAVAGWPRQWSLGKAGMFLFAIIASIAMTSSWSVPVNVLAPAMMLAAIGAIHGSRERGILYAASGAIVIFAIWRLSLTSIPTLWLIADNFAQAMGRIVGWIAGEPLWVGATYGGFDFLVLMLAFCAGWLALSPGPWLWRLIFALAAIALGQIIYLWALSAAPKLLAVLPPPKQPDPAIPFQQDTKTWPDMVRDVVPWNAPVLCALIQLTIAGFMLRWASLRELPTRRESAPGGWRMDRVPASILCGFLALLVPAVMLFGTGPADQLKGKKIVFYENGFLNWLRAEHGQYGRLSIGMYGMMPSFVQSLGGRALISPDLSDADLKDADVLVILYPNRAWSDWSESNGQIQRIWNFIRRGGSLLIFSDHTIREVDGRNRANDLLQPREFANSRRAELQKFLEICQAHRVEVDSGAPISGVLPVAPEDFADDVPKGFDQKPANLAYDAAHEKQAKAEYDRLRKLADSQDSALRVRFDAAEFAVGGWLQSYEALAHPTTTGMHDDRNQFGVVIGASMETHWPARPLLVGRWGWIDEGDAGSASAMLGNHKYDPGEKLGDMVLAAEQTVGDGRIVAFSDTSSATNGINVGAHQFTSRLLCYLAGGGANPQSPWRQVLGALSALALVLLVGGRPVAWRAGSVGLLLACAIGVCISRTFDATEVIPDGSMIQGDRPVVNSDPVTGHAQTPRQEWTPAPSGGRSRLMYIDSSHLPESSEESWRPDGTMGLCMAFMRDGYLALQLPELTAARLSKAAFYVCVGPTRHFTPAEHEIIRTYINDGGIFIITAGWDKTGAAQELLSDYGMYIGIAPPMPGAPAPEPLGFFKAPYYQSPDESKYQCFVRFFAAWPVGPNPAQTKLDGLTAIANGRLSNNQDLPVILVRQLGKGKIVLVGDTCFAMNKNLETEGGELFDQMRENADFWRWFIPYLTESTPWIPPKQVPLDPATGKPLAPETQPTTQPDTQPAEAPMTQPLGPALPATEPTPPAQPTTVPTQPTAEVLMRTGPSRRASLDAECASVSGTAAKNECGGQCPPYDSMCRVGRALPAVFSEHYVGTSACRFCSLLRYSGGGLGWGPFAREILARHNPHPSPPPEYRRRGQELRADSLYEEAA